MVFDLLASGRIHVSTLLLLEHHLTDENHAELLEACAGKSTREVEKILAARAPKPDVPSTIERLPNQTAPSLPTLAPAPTPSPKPAAPPRPRPLSEGRYKVQFTASAELARKLERAVALMRHRNPTGDLAVVAEAALDLLLSKLEKECLGKAKKPRAKARGRETDKVSRPVRRDVFSRDGEQCSFTDGDGNRCPERGFLEIDHRPPRAMGGLGLTENLRVLCRAHNKYLAEKVFGREHVERAIERSRQEKQAKPKREEKRAAVAEPAGTPNTPSSRPFFDVACRGLVNMGFRETESRRALEEVLGRHPDGPPAVEVLLREALGVLT